MSVLFRDAGGKVHRLPTVRWCEHLFPLTYKTSKKTKKTFLDELARTQGDHFGALSSFGGATSMEQDAETIMRDAEEMVGEPMPRAEAEKEVRRNQKAWTTPKKVIDCLERLQHAFENGDLAKTGLIQPGVFGSKAELDELGDEIAGLLTDVRAAQQQHRFPHACFALSSDDDLPADALIAPHSRAEPVTRHPESGAEPKCPTCGSSSVLSRDGNVGVCRCGALLWFSD